MPRNFAPEPPMRHTLHPQLEIGACQIADIQINPKSRDDIPAILIGLQHLYTDEGLRGCLFDLLEREVLPDVDLDNGRPGMHLWAILVMAVLKQGLNCDFDRLEGLVNHYDVIRQMLGHGVYSDTRYTVQQIKDNVSLLTPSVLSKVGALVVESGHRVSKKKPGERLRGRCDSFVVETDVHYPTDTGLLWDSLRKLLGLLEEASREDGIPGWRQAKYRRRKLKRLFNRVRRARDARSRPEQVREYLDAAGQLAGQARCALEVLSGMARAEPRLVRMNRIAQYLWYAGRLSEQADRRLLRGETIPQDEKVFSIFEPHTRWISKGKVGRPVELGVPVCVLEDQYGLLLHHRVMWKEGDVEIAVPMIGEAREKYPDLKLCSFDKGFHSPENRRRLDELLEDNVLPRKGPWTRADRVRETGAVFRAARQQHPAIESAIHNLEHRGLDRVRSHGVEGFERTVALSVLACNVHRIGRMIRDRAREAERRRRRAA